MHFVPNTTYWVVTLAIVISAGSPAPAQRDRPSAGPRETLLKVVSEHGVTNQRVLDAIGSTPRHLFVPEEQRKYAWYDMALPIGNKQTISPASVVGLMTQYLDPQPTDKVLEIGTGSGYQAAVLSPLVKEVYSIEIVEPLGKTAAQTLKKLSYRNVSTKIGDGYQGWAEHAPFDKIIVTCSPERIPQPLVDQLQEGGRMIIPLGERFQQALYLFTKSDGQIRKEALEPTFFVPMTGHAEDIREVKEDSGRPLLLNGSFEDVAFENLPKGWYYVRHGIVQSNTAAPDGQNSFVFSNDVPGRWAQALQAMGADGRKLKRIDVSLSVRGKNVDLGPRGNTQFHAGLGFFDANRTPIGEEVLGIWSGTFGWSRKSMQVDVPRRARICIIAVGLCGSTGELAFDDIEIKVVEQ